MTNAQKTLVRLFLATLKRVAADVNHIEGEGGPLREGQEVQEWDAIEACLIDKVTDPLARTGDTWSLGVLGCRSPSWILGLQGVNR
jgi:hypothetical protein